MADRPRRATVRHRRAQPAPGRTRRINLRCTDAEYRMLADAAAQTGLTVGGYAATLALTHLQAAQSSTDPAARALLLELLAARGQLRRYGNNVNQAVRVFHSIGQPPPWLLDAIRITDQAVRRIDQAADRLAHPAGAAAPRPASAGTPNTGRPSSVPPDKDSRGIR